MRSRHLTYWGQRNFEEQENLVNIDQFKCIFQPNISDNLAEAIMNNIEFSKFHQVGITPDMIIDAFKLFLEEQEKLKESKEE